MDPHRLGISFTWTFPDNGCSRRLTPKMTSTFTGLEGTPILTHTQIYLIDLSI